MRGTRSADVQHCTYTVLKPDGRNVDSVATLPRNPTTDDVRSVVSRFFDGGAAEYVAVLHDNRRADMFVDEHSHLKHMLRNEIATRLFRAPALQIDPQRDPETLPYIAGPAVLFDRPIWPGTKLSA